MDNLSTGKLINDLFEFAKGSYCFPKLREDGETDPYFSRVSS